MIEAKRYIFSFTASAIRVNELEIVIKSILHIADFDVTNDLGNGKESTGKRILSDLKKRADQLDEKLMRLYLNTDFQTKRHIAFLSICKAYDFIRDFVIEVLRDKYLVFDYQITEGDFLTFYRRKLEFHTEMDSLSDDTQYKIKQVTFKILEQAGIIDSAKNKMIQPQILGSEFKSAMLNGENEWLKVFLLSDNDIQKVN